MESVESAHWLSNDPSIVRRDPSRLAVTFPTPVIVLTVAMVTPSGESRALKVSAALAASVDIADKNKSPLERTAAEKRRGPARRGRIEMHIAIEFYDRKQPEGATFLVVFRLDP